MDHPKKPLVSVILPSFNRAQLISQSIWSVLQQTYSNLELIVVDDASTDRTSEVVHEISDDRIRVIRNTQNIGQAASENRGVAEANGELIAFIDSDDLWHKDKLEIQVKELQLAPDNVGVVYCFSAKEPTARFQSANQYSQRRRTFHSLLSNRLKITTSQILVRKRCLVSIGGWDESLPSLIDYDLCLRLSRLYDFRAVQGGLVTSIEHNLGRVSDSEQARIKGIQMFMWKWSDVLEQNVGPAGRKKFAELRFSHYYKSLALQNLRLGRRSSAVRAFHKYLMHRGRHWKFIVYFVCLVFIRIDLRRRSGGLRHGKGTSSYWQ